MSGLTFGADAWGGLQDMFSAAQTAGADQSFTTARTSDTATGDAITGAAPIDNSDGGSWGGFWRDVAGSVVGYAIARDASKNAVAQPGQPIYTTAPPAPVASSTPGWLLPVALVGAGVLLFVAVRKG